MPPSSAGGGTSTTPARDMRRTQLFAIWMCQFVEGVHTTLPYALAVFLVRSMLKGGSGGEGGEANPPPSEKSVGWTTGALAACWSLAQFCTSMLWGRVSDAGLGRKPLLAMSAVSSGVSVLFFGSSRSLAAAALSRLVGGAFNCTFVALKCVIAESSSSGKQSGPMSILALAWGCGTIVGPALGALADPCSKGEASWVARSAALCRPASPSPSSSSSSSGPSSAAVRDEGGLFRRHPYLFPCVAAAALSAAAVVNATLVLEETLPAIVEKKRQRKLRGGAERRGLLSSQLSPSSSSLSSRVLGDALGDALSSRARSLRRVMTFSSPYALVGAGALRRNGGSGDGSGERGSGALLELELEPSRSGGGGRSAPLAPPPPPPPPQQQQQREQQQQQGSSPSTSPAKRREQPRAPPSAFAVPPPDSAGNDAEKGRSTASGVSTVNGNGSGPLAAVPCSPSRSPPSRRPGGGGGGGGGETATSTASTTTPWRQLPQVRITLLGYCCVAFLYNLLDELVPIFASAAEEDGGLGWDPAQLAPPLAVGGLALILWSQLGYFRLQRRVGTLRTARCGLAGMAPCCLLLAAPSLLPEGIPRAASLSLLLVLRSCFANNAFTSSMVLVNEAAPRESIGLVNGAGQTLASAVRALGPALGGGLWGFSSTSLHPPLGQFLPFFLVSLGLLAASLIYTRVLPPPGELAAAEEEERASYQLVSSAAEAAEAAAAAMATELSSSSSSFGASEGGKKRSASSSFSSSPTPLLFEDDSAADGAVKVVVVVPPSSTNG